DRAELLVPVQVAGSDGGFRVLDVDPHAWLAARAPNREPWILLQAGSGAGLPLELQLGPPTQQARFVSLHVRAVTGRPIETAEAELAGSSGPRYDAHTGRWAALPECETARADASGHMELAQALGKLDVLQVHAPGFAPQRLTLASPRSLVELTL